MNKNTRKTYFPTLLAAVALSLAASLLPGKPDADPAKGTAETIYHLTTTAVFAAYLVVIIFIGSDATSHRYGMGKAYAVTLAAGLVLILATKLAAHVRPDVSDVILLAGMAALSFKMVSRDRKLASGSGQKSVKDNEEGADEK